MELPTWIFVRSMQDDYWRLGSGVVHRTCVLDVSGAGPLVLRFAALRRRTRERRIINSSTSVCYARDVISCHLS